MDLFFVFPFHSEKVRSLLLATYGCHEYCNSFQRLGICFSTPIAFEAFYFVIFILDQGFEGFEGI
jgi:hypothetical protein